MSLSNKAVFHVLKATGPSNKPTITREGRGFLSECKAKSAAEAMAKANPGARFYVARTISGHMKRPEVQSKSY